MSANSLSSFPDIYFITTTTVAWVDVFTNKRYRHCLVDSLKYCQQHKGLVIHAWCIMSNHLHMLASVNGQITISDIMRDFKKYTSHTIAADLKVEVESRKEWMLNLFEFAGMMHRKHHDFKLWKDNFYNVILESNFMIDQKLNYIHDNPVRAEIVDEPHHYIFSSARDYAGMKGLIEVVLL